MYRNLTKLSFAMVVAVGLVALGITSIQTPTWAQTAGGGPLACAVGQGAFFDSDTHSWECAELAFACDEGKGAFFDEETNIWECADIIGPSKLVFATSTRTVGGAIGGVAGATTICQELADNAGLGEGKIFLPWLSDSDDSPATTFTRSSGRYVLVGGQVVAFNWDDLVDGGSLHTQIWLDEAGNNTTSQLFVWTGTQLSGLAFPPNRTCDDWTDTNASGIVGFNGSPPLTAAGWTDVTAVVSPAVAACTQAWHIYCFEQ